MRTTMIVGFAAALMLAGCGTSTGDRMASGAMVGAAGGAAIGALAGNPAAGAAAGAIAGDNLGFWVGRRFGYDFAVRHSRVLRLTTTRLEIGRYLFQRHGGKVVFFGRFFSGLRTFAAFLAGVNWMPWARFLLFNVAGGAVWATVFGSAAYVFGRQFEDFNGSISMVGLIVAVVAVSFGFWFARRYEAQLESMVKKRDEKSPAEAGHYV